MKQELFRRLLSCLPYSDKIGGLKKTMSTKTTFKQKSVNIKVGNKINITQLIAENITLSLLPTSTYIFFGLSNFYLSDLDDIKTDKKYSSHISFCVWFNFIKILFRLL
jgi:hypothetical protein